MPETKLTRRQKTVLWALENGWIAQMHRPVGPFSSPLYVLRASTAMEAEGRMVQRRTIRALLEAGLAVQLYFPSLNVTWVFGAQYHAAHAEAFAILTAPTPPRTTKHPPPRFRDRFRHVAS